MKKRINILSIFLLLQISFVGLIKAGDQIANDTIYFDLGSAIYSAEGLNSYVEFPVFISGPNDTVNAIDFWFPFNTEKLSFISTTSQYPTLDVFSNYNLANETLSSTSSTFSIYEYLPNLTALIIVKFQLNNPCDRIEIVDLINPIALINGLDAAYFITEPTPIILPDVQINSISPFCPNTPISFSFANEVNGQSINNYAWAFGNNVTATGQSPSVSIEGESIQSFSLTLTTDLGCIYEIESLINISPGPVASFTSSVLTNTTEVEFSSTSTISNGSISGYEWNFGDNTPTSTEQAPSHTYSASGPYEVTLTATSDLGCTDDITITVDVPVGIENLPKQSLVLIYPNPAETVLNILPKENCTYMLTDQLGQTVAAGSIKGFVQHALNVEEYATGIYNLTLASGATIQTIRVVIR
jgi:hypothetical protein